MSRWNIAVALLLIGLLLIPPTALARGGRGGGGGGGGRAGGGGGGGAMRGGGGGGGGGARPSYGGGHSPSMSRPSNAGSRPSQGARPQTNNRPPARPTTRPTTRPGSNPGSRPVAGAGTRPATGINSRPSASQVQDFLRPADGAGRPGAGTRPAQGNPAVADLLRQPQGPGTRGDALPGNRTDRTDRTDRVGDRGEQRPARIADRGDMRSNLADGRGDRRTDRQQDLGRNGDHVRDELHGHYDHDHLFNDFWSDHPHAHYHFHQNPAFWTWASWGTAAAFLPWNWQSSVYYDYGTGGNVVYEGDTVVVSGTAIPAETYAEQATQIATSAPEVDPDKLEWLPLGVFAVAMDEPNAPAPNMFLQLAVSKEGIIAGTYQNKDTGKAESVEGMVDQKSQRAAWTIVGQSSPIMEAGLYNLTQNETRALVHFADGSTQQWLLVRIENPDVPNGQ